MEAPDTNAKIALLCSSSISKPARKHKQNAKSECSERIRQQGEGHAHAFRIATHRLKDESKMSETVMKKSPAHICADAVAG
jgi:hypothetical protein